jgi:hypothetical protein
MLKRNALWVDLVVQTDDWTWSALLGWLGRDPLLQHGETEVLNRTSSIQVNKPLSDGILHRLRPSIERGRPIGVELWTPQF